MRIGLIFFFLNPKISRTKSHVTDALPTALPIPRTNEDVSRVKRSTWYKWSRGEFRTGQTIWRVVVFLLFFIYVSFLHILFYRKHSCNNRKTKSKTNTTKKENIQKCWGQPASNSIWLCPSNKTKFFFFFFFFFLNLF